MGSMVLLYLSGNLVSFIVIGLLSKAAFNIFNAANAFRALALALPAAIAIPLFPHISTLHKEEAFSQIRSRTWQTLRFTAILVVPGVLALAVYRVNILNILYSHAYLGASTALAILAVSAIPAALSQIIGTTMTSIGRTRLELYITSLQVACLAIVSALIVEPSKFAWTSDLGFLIHNSVVAGVASLLPAGFAPSAASWTGINGAAIAVLVASFAAFALNAYFLYTLLGVPDPGHPDHHDPRELDRELPRDLPAQRPAPHQPLLPARGGSDPGVRGLPARPRGRRRALQRGRGAHRPVDGPPGVDRPVLLEDLLEKGVPAGESAPSEWRRGARPARGGMGPGGTTETTPIERRAADGPMTPTRHPSTRGGGVYRPATNALNRSAR